MSIIQGGLMLSNLPESSASDYFRVTLSQLRLSSKLCNTVVGIIMPRIFMSQNPHNAMEGILKNKPNLLPRLL